MLPSIITNFTAAHPEISAPLAKLNRYCLATDATAADKFNYCLYRFWNAVKAIFNKSDWQFARNELVEEHAPKIIKATLGDVIDCNSFYVGIIVDGILALRTDRKLQSGNLNDKIQHQIDEEIYKLLQLSKDKNSDLKGNEGNHPLRDIFATQLLNQKANQKLNPDEIDEEAVVFNERKLVMALNCVETSKITSYIENFFTAAGEQGDLEQSSVKSINRAFNVIHILFHKNAKNWIPKIPMLISQLLALKENTQAQASR